MSRGVEKLHPELISICNEFVSRCKARGLNVLITETLRTKAEQDALYAQGRTAPGSIVTNAKYPRSAHCWGVAFDFCRNVKGREFDDSDGFFAKCGAVGKELGLTWGGDWKSFVDKPHLEMPEYMRNSSTSWLIATYGTPDQFFKTWADAVQPVKEDEEMDVSKLTDAEILALGNRIQEVLGKQAPSDWSQDARDWAEKNGIIKGDDNGSKQYKAFVTREQLAVIEERLHG